jgi:hypothetical protein
MLDALESLDVVEISELDFDRKMLERAGGSGGRASNTRVASVMCVSEEGISMLHQIWLRYVIELVGSDKECRRQPVCVEGEGELAEYDRLSARHTPPKFKPSELILIGAMSPRQQD